MSTELPVSGGLGQASFFLPSFKVPFLGWGENKHPQQSLLLPSCHQPCSQPGSRVLMPQHVQGDAGTKPGSSTGPPTLYNATPLAQAPFLESLVCFLFNKLPGQLSLPQAEALLSGPFLELNILDF